MSKITNDGLTWSGNSGRQRVNKQVIVVQSVSSRCRTSVERCLLYGLCSDLFVRHACRLVEVSDIVSCRAEHPGAAGEDDVLHTEMVV